jgi:hypothetical protein
MPTVSTSLRCPWAVNLAIFDTPRTHKHNLPRFTRALPESKYATILLYSTSNILRRLPINICLRRLSLIAALFVETNGIYFGLPGVDPWDEPRDARRYRGPHPVVAHPPCDRWHQLSAVNHKRWGYKINDDERCFASALFIVRKYGGVLEHPAESRAFKFHGIPEPTAGGWQKTIDDDWVMEICQSAYGHRARKRTWLLYHGDQAPRPIDWPTKRGECQIGNFDQKLPQLPIAERSATPPDFRDLLISIAKLAKVRRLANALNPPSRPASTGAYSS